MALRIRTPSPFLLPTKMADRTLRRLILALLALTAAEGWNIEQSEPVVKRAGESHTLTCKISGLDFSGYPWSWIRKVPGKGLEFISYIGPFSTPKYYSPLVQERFTISRRDSSSQLDLHINSLMTEDTAAYFCVRSTMIDISHQQK